jgi:hypothetical protein
MPSPADVSEKIRNRLRLGVLRLNSDSRMYAGSGCGHPCDGCDWPIEPDRVEYEFLLEDGRNLRLHLECAAVLEAERRKLNSSPESRA